MPHIHTKDGQHDLTVSAYIVRTDFARPKLLLHKHKKLNTWLQFGGHVELDENPWQSMRHELMEETGYGLEQLELLQPADRLKKVSGKSVLHPQPVYINTHPIDTGDLNGSTHYHMDIGYLFVTTEEPKHPLAEGESKEMILVDREELLKISKDELWPSTLDICLHILDVCLPQWEHVNPDDLA